MTLWRNYFFKNHVAVGMVVLYAMLKRVHSKACDPGFAGIAFKI